MHICVAIRINGKVKLKLLVLICVTETKKEKVVVENIQIRAPRTGCLVLVVTLTNFLGKISCYVNIQVEPVVSQIEVIMMFQCYQD